MAKLRSISNLNNKRRLVNFRWNETIDWEEDFHDRLGLGLWLGVKGIPIPNELGQDHRSFWLFVFMSSWCMGCSMGEYLSEFVILPVNRHRLTFTFVLPPLPAKITWGIPTFHLLPFQYLSPPLLQSNSLFKLFILFSHCRSRYEEGVLSPYLLLPDNKLCTLCLIHNWGDW